MIELRDTQIQGMISLDPDLATSVMDSGITFVEFSTVHQGLGNVHERFADILAQYESWNIETEERHIDIAQPDVAFFFERGLATRSTPEGTLSIIDPSYITGRVELRPSGWKMTYLQVVGHVSETEEEPVQE